MTIGDAWIGQALLPIGFVMACGENFEIRNLLALDNEVTCRPGSRLALGWDGRLRSLTLGVGDEP